MAKRWTAHEWALVLIVTGLIAAVLIVLTGVLILGVLEKPRDLDAVVALVVAILPVLSLIAGLLLKPRE